MRGMTMNGNNTSGAKRLLKAARPAAITMALLASSCVSAVEIETGNTDFKLRWDNTVRYNVGVRARNCDINICGNGAGAGDFTAHQSDRKFADRGDVIMNRLDIFSEFDLVFKQDSGFRVSAAGWYDNAYKGNVQGDPALNLAPGGIGQGAGPAGSPHSDFVKRWNKGPSGEILDAFLFTKLNIGGVPINLKAGQHNIYWGESLFSFVGGVAYAQGPVDIRKALANPGVEAKEVFKPLKQVSFSADLTDRLTIAGQYLLDWKPSTLPDGGTYFGPVDGFSQGGGGSIFGIPFGGITAAPTKKRGDFGLAAKWRPEWLDGTAGFYYREYTDKLPQLVINRNTFIGTNLVPQEFGLDYSTPRQKMLAFSLSKQVGDISTGMDLTYRKDAQLAAVPLATLAGQSNIGTGALGNSMLPTGNVFTGVFNAIAYFGKNPVFDSAALQAELNFAHLDKVTKSPGSFYGKGYNCSAEKAGKDFAYGCATKDAFGLAMQFTPKWFQVMNGVDLEMPLFVGLGLKGNSVVPFGDNQGQGQYSVGLSADVKNQYSISLKYNGFIAKHANDALGAFSDSNASLGKYWDRNWVSLTLKTTF